MVWVFVVVELGHGGWGMREVKLCVCVYVVRGVCAWKFTRGSEHVV